MRNLGITASRRTVLSGLRAAVLLFTVLGVFSGAHAASSGCSMAVVAEPFVLPDGSEHPGGKLTLCDRRYNPVQSVLATYVDGISAGMFVTDLRRTEGADERRDFVTFKRQADGRLHLVGYTVPGERGRELHTLRAPGV